MASRFLSPIEDCESPSKSGRCECFVSSSFIERVKRYYPPRCLHELLKLLSPTLQQPDCILGGIRDLDPGDAEPGYCYSKQFPFKLTGEGDEKPCPDNQVFSVYLTSDLVVFEFGWDEVDPDDPQRHRGRRGCQR